VCAAAEIGEDLRKTSEGVAAEIERLVAPTLRDLGYAVVRILLGGGQRTKLQLMIERLDGRPIVVDDCAGASRAVEAILDVEDPLRTAYVLEVSSPGIDRPLTRLGDFERFAGHLARVEMSVPHDGRKRFTGILAGVDDHSILLDCEGERLVLGFREMAKAKLVLTDALIAEHQAAEAAAEADAEADVEGNE